MQPTSILRLSHVFLENRFNKKCLTRLSVNLTNNFSETISYDIYNVFSYLGPITPNFYYACTETAIRLLLV